MKEILRLESVDAKEIESSPFCEYLTGWSLILRKRQHRSINFSKMYPNSCSYLCDDQHGFGPCDIWLLYFLCEGVSDDHMLTVS